MKVKIYGAGSIGNHLANASRSLGWEVDICDIDEKALKKGAIIISETNKNYKYDKYLNQYISTQKKYSNTLITFFKFL